MSPSVPSIPSTTPARPARSLGALITAGLLSWVVISLGFLGLHLLMQERPQFIGEPARAAHTELLQEAPRIVVRKSSDDISVIKSAQPDSSEITVKMHGRRDYRGLRTVMDMSGEIHARHTLTNPFDEPLFVLFKCPHPRTESKSEAGLLAGGLKLTASLPGVQENTREAWVWSGTLEARGAVTLEISYQASSLKGLAYRVSEPAAEPVKHLRVAFHRQDLNSLRFASGEGPIAVASDPVVWERREFLVPDSFSASIVETRHLHGSLLHLLEVGPIICLLFLLAVAAVIAARQRLTALQLCTIAAGYALYFPLMLYLSSRFSFHVALIIAVVVPGALLVNYARVLLGPALGLFGGIVFLLLYQVFPTLAAFAGWNRGMVLLCLGVVTFAVLINLQNQALRRKALAAWVALACAFAPARAADVQVIVPGKLVAESAPGALATPPLLAFQPAEYEVRHEAAFFHVEATLAFEVLRAGDMPAVLFAQPIHLQQSNIKASGSEVAQFVTQGNRLALLAQQAGSGVLHCSYRVPIETREGRKRAQFPMLAGPSSRVRLESSRAALEFIGGTLWTKSAQEQATVYELGVAGDETLIIEWHEAEAAATASGAAQEFYGIGITRARHLTVLHSDGSCSHFAEFEAPAAQPEEFRLRLPPKARLLSVSVNGVEAAAPALADQLCRVPLPAREPGKAAHRLSFRLAYPPVRLGFVGAVELGLPEVFQTVGTLEWTAVLPSGFSAQVISSGLEVQKTAPDLAPFGDYGRILKTHPQTHLAKDLAPPGPISLHLRYRQAIPSLEAP